MDVSSTFYARAVNSTVNLNWAFLIYWIVALLSATLFAFYFNRIVGIVISFLLRPILWRKYRIRVQVQSLKVSFLGGRIFFKNLIIITRNQMYLMHQGTFTWRYWLLHTRKTKLLLEQQHQKSAINAGLSARNFLSVMGLEVFLYNRTGAYDIITEKLKEDKTNESNHEYSEYSEANQRPGNSNSLSGSLDSILTDDNISNAHSTQSYHNVESSNLDEASLYRVKTAIEQEEIVDSTFLDILPLDVEVEKGSVIIGNETTPSLLVALCSTMKGTIDASEPASNLDYYRSNFDVDCSDFKIDLRPNVTFKSIEKLDDEINRFVVRNTEHKFSLWKFFSGIADRIVYVLFCIGSVAFFCLPLGSKKSHQNPATDFSEESTAFGSASKEKDDDKWYGLARYLTEKSDADLTSSTRIAGEDTSTKQNNDKLNQQYFGEYARCTNIFESTRTKIKYYYDSPGLVPPVQITSNPVTGPNIGNGCDAPQTGLDISTFGASMHYGPWADKQRGPIQKLIFPQICRDSEPFKKLCTGMRRQYTDFVINVEFEDEATLQIPHREPSKDEVYQKETAATANVRPFGWIELKFSKDTSIWISTSYIPEEEAGYDNHLKISLNDVEISTSVNHDTLFKAAKHFVDASIGYPLEWNGEAIWTFDMRSTAAELYILREHFSLLADLFTDFSSGDPIPYEVFRPFVYRINWTVDDYKLFFNINERNVIDNPLDHSNNTYFATSGEELLLKIDIPLETVYRKSTEVSYELSTNYFVLSLEPPPWNTIANFMDTPMIGKSFNFKLTGSYMYYSNIEVDAIDTIIVNCICEDTTLECYGFVIKYFLFLKENYFGDDIKFRTMAEFTSDVIKNRGNPLHLREKQPEKTRMKNDRDFFFSFCVRNGCAILPVHLYDCGSMIAGHFKKLDIDIRINDYYMDIQANVPHAFIEYVDMVGHTNIFDNIKLKKPIKHDLELDRLAIHGHRMFGLPPENFSYFCRWTFDLGPIVIDSGIQFMTALVQSLVCAGFGYTDVENSLQMPEQEIMNIMNLSFTAPSVKIKLQESDYAFNINLTPVNLTLSDQMVDKFSDRMDVDIRNITINCYHNAERIFNLKTSLKLTNFGKKRQATERREAQIEHVHANDGPFHRCPFLLPESYRNRQYRKAYMNIIPSIDLPDAPEPYLESTIDNIVREYPQKLRNKLADSYGNKDDDSFGHHAIPSINLESDQNSDELCKYEDFIIKLGRVDAAFKLQLLDALCSILSNSLNLSIYRVTDSIQVDVFMYLQRTRLPFSMKVALVCPYISLCMEDSGNFKFDIQNIFLRFSQYSESDDSESEKIINLDFRSGGMRLKGFKEQSKESLHASVSNVGVQMTSSKSSTILNPHIGDFKLLLLPEDIVWVLTEVDKLLQGVSGLRNVMKENEESKESAAMEFVYQVSMAGVKYKIVHDPPCITKPSYITRFSNKHTRLHNSWRIMTRLRHVMKNLPESWHRKANALFKAKDWEVPSGGPDDVFRIFLNWRQWESQNIQDSYILKHAFLLDKVRKISKKMSLIGILERFDFMLYTVKGRFSIDDIRISVKDGEKADALKENISELISGNVDSCRDVNIEIHSANAKLREIIHSAQLFVSTGADLIDYLQNVKKKKDTANTSKVTHSGETRTILTTVRMSVNEFSLESVLNETAFTVRGNKIILTALAIKGDQLEALTMHHSIDTLEGALLSGNSQIVKANCKSHNATFSIIGDVISGTRTLSITNGDISVLCLPGTERLISAIDDFMKTEYPVIESFWKLIARKKQTVRSKERYNIPLKGSFAVSIHYDKLTLKFRLLSLLEYAVTISDIQLDASAKERKLVNTFSIYRILSSLTSRRKEGDYQYLYCFLDKTTGILSVRPRNEEEYDAFCKMSVGNGRVQMSQADLLDIIEQARWDLRIAKCDVERIISKFQQLSARIRPTSTEPAISTPQNMGSQRKQSKFSKTMKKIHILFSLGCNAMGIMLRANGNQFGIDSSNVLLLVNAMDCGVPGVKPCGTLKMPSSRISISSDKSGNQRYLVLHSHLSIDVINPPLSIGKLQRLVVSSDFFRIALTPVISKRMIDTFKKVLSLFQTKQIIPVQPIVEKSDKFDLPVLRTILSFFAIKIKAQNLCIGWLFESDDGYYTFDYSQPGVIIGFESSEIICAKGAGKMSASGLYVSFAHGRKPSDFYPMKSERDSKNRVFFPMFNLVYGIADEGDNKCLQIKVDGDVVDFSLQTTVFLVAKPLGRSISQLQREFKEVRRRLSFSSNGETKIDRNESIQKVTKGLFGISNLNCVLKFNGAKFSIVDPNLKIGNEIPKFSVQAPGLSTMLEWKRKLTPTDRHQVFVSVDISHTDNQLTYTCVPILASIVDSCRDFMRTDARQINLRPNNDNISGSLSQWHKILKSIQFEFTLKIEPQRLILTCNPRANVAAEISTNEIHSVISSDKTYSGLIFIENLSAEIRHAYSKEASTKLFFRGITLNMSLDVEEGKRNFFPVLCVNKISALVNMQQRQDLDVFRDLWIPGTYYRADSGRQKHDASTESRKKFAEMLREVSSTSAFPWMLVFVAKKIELELRFGTSLGTFKGHIEDTWAVSKKEMNWDQNARAELGKIYLESKGRLGGKLTINQLRAASVISWKKDGIALDVPLVMTSIGISTIEAGVSLDYHPFLVVEIGDLKLGVLNRHTNNASDTLAASASAGNLKIFTTALAASSLVDIYTIGLRIRQEIHISYHQVLNDDDDMTDLGSRVRLSKKRKTISEAFLGVIQQLRTELDLNVGTTVIQVCPSSLTDTQALVVHLGYTEVKFSQDSIEGLKNLLVLRLKNSVISLSTYKHKMKEDIFDQDLHHYIDLAGKISGGNIISLPSLEITEHTMESFENNLVQYTYNLAFGNKIDVRWNLGSVYFIRQMWYTHANALKTRLQALRILEYDEMGDNVEDNYKESLLETVNIEDRLKDVERDKKYEYLATEEPHIETPQLRDLGNATPPLEWFGLHRDKFPKLTHQMIIVNLQKMIVKAENQYSKILH